jgi:hypothetical protein
LSHIPDLFALVIFQVEFHMLPLGSLRPRSSCLCLSHSWDHKHESLCQNLCVEMRSYYLFPSLVPGTTAVCPACHQFFQSCLIHWWD